MRTILFQILVIGLLSMTLTDPVQAIPPLPSSFYGAVQVNGRGVPDGTVIQALIGGQVVARTYSQTYQGSTVYALDVPGDDPGTTASEGGHDQETIQFKVGGAPAIQTASWKSGTNTALNLTVSTPLPLEEPQATPPPAPTQTQIIRMAEATETQATAASEQPAANVLPAAENPPAAEPSPTAVSQPEEGPGMNGAPTTNLARPAGLLAAATPTAALAEKSSDAFSGSAAPKASDLRPPAVKRGSVWIKIAGIAAVPVVGLSAWGVIAILRKTRRKSGSAPSIQG
jgi:hypothetical protein